MNSIFELIMLTLLFLSNCKTYGNRVHESLDDPLILSQQNSTEAKSRVVFLSMAKFYF